MRAYFKMAILLLLVGGTGAWLVLGWRMALSYLLGGAVSLLNARLLATSLERLLEPGGGLQARGVLVRSLGRLLLISGGLFAMILTSFLDPLGFLAGFSVGVFSVFIEEVRRALWGGR